jgi:hypothetical protein
VDLTPGHGSCKNPDDILWDPPRGGEPPNVPSGSSNPWGPEPYRLWPPGGSSSKPGTGGGILWDPPLPGGDKPNVLSGPSGSSNPWGPEPYRPGLAGEKPNVNSGPYILWDPVRQAPGGQNILWNNRITFDDYVENRGLYGFNPQPEPPAIDYNFDEFEERRQGLLFGHHPDNIWKAEAEKKYYYKPKFR